MINRRDFIAGSIGGLMAVAASQGRPEAAGDAVAPQKSRGKTRIALVKTSDRKTGIRKAIEMLGINPVNGKNVLLKPNFNTADPFPGSTHNDTLISLIAQLQLMGARGITVGERSGPPDTADVMKDLGVPRICRDMGVRLINFEELSDEGWVKIRPERSHWRNGFHVAKPVLDADCIVTTCCLKTHGFGGVFTMSLKLSVGITHKGDMTELHTSIRSMRKMIAEINQAYTPSLILLDGVEAFVDGGPMKGKQKRADIIMAGTDRVAIDAAGVAVLKDLGSNSAIMERKIFDQEQIARAVELGLGAAGPEEIEIITDDEGSMVSADRIRAILMKG